MVRYIVCFLGVFGLPCLWYQLNSIASFFSVQYSSLRNLLLPQDCEHKHLSISNSVADTAVHQRGSYMQSSTRNFSFERSSTGVYSVIYIRNAFHSDLSQELQAMRHKVFSSRKSILLSSCLSLAFVKVTSHFHNSFTSEASHPSVLSLSLSVHGHHARLCAVRRWAVGNTVPPQKCSLTKKYIYLEYSGIRPFQVRPLYFSVSRTLT